MGGPIPYASTAIAASITSNPYQLFSVVADLEIYYYEVGTKDCVCISASEATSRMFISLIVLNPMIVSSFEE